MINVFLIDDSIVVRKGFKDIFKEQPDINVLGEANNPIDAYEVFKTTGLPDLFILDIEMPKMDGLTFLKQINAQRPTPVIMCSTLLSKGSNELLEALSLGAFSVIEKPKIKLKDFFLEYKDNVLQQVRASVKAQITYKKNTYCHNTSLDNKTIETKPSHKIVALASSTGGVQVLEEILLNVKSNHPAIVIVQHMPMGFTKNFALRLDGLSSVSKITEAQDGELLETNRVYIAPGQRHMEITKQGFQYYIQLKDYPKVDFHKPSATVLFQSISKVANANATGVVLTGMGYDGAKGLLSMKRAGSKTYSQNKQTSTVYGMPKHAFELGASQKELSIFEIIKVINSF